MRKEMVAGVPFSKPVVLGAQKSRPSRESLNEANLDVSDAPGLLRRHRK
jgi:hypothetical protein